MYSKVGKIICGIAKVCGVLGIIAMVLGFLGAVLGLLAGEDELFFIALIVVGSGLAVLIGSFPLYAIGQLIDDVHEIRIKVVDEPMKNAAYMYQYQPVYQPAYQPTYQQAAQPSAPPMTQPAMAPVQADFEKTM
jgi:uncharacterized membrane protein YedE/YeeE